MTGDRPRVLLVGVGEMGRPYLDDLLSRPVDVHVVDTAARADALRATGAGVTVTASAAEEDVIAAALEAAAAFAPTTVIPFAEPHVLAAALVQAEHRLDGPGIRATQASRNKALQRTLLRAAGVSQPEFVFTDQLDTALEFLHRHGRVVVKMTRGSGSRGVRLAIDTDTLTAAFRELAANEPVLVEEYVAGAEYSAEILVDGGRIAFINVTAKQTSGPPEFVETGHTVPAPLPAPQRDRVQTLMTQVIAALDIRRSLVHAEFLIREDRLYLVEVALRTPGDHILEVIGHAYGLSPYAAVIDLYLGHADALPATRAPRHTTAIRYLRPKPGTIVSIGGAADDPAVIRLHYPYEVGDVVPVLRSSRDRGGYAILRGESEADIEAAWKPLSEALHVNTVSPAP